MDNHQQRLKSEVELQGVQYQKGCQTCQHSVAHAEGLWCKLWDCESIGYCEGYEYESGTA